jgi:hypothetical protein
METIPIADWDEFVRLTISLDGWAFRGQRDSRWPLFSSLSRHLRDFVPDRGIWQEREERAIRVFRRKAHNYVQESLLEDDLRCLALMQHHGAPTRLLDFTKSPHVAAFFALEGATGDCAVFALNTPVLWQASPKESPTLGHERVDPRINGNFAKYFLPNRNEFVWIGEPMQLDRRLMAQSGVFVIPGVIDKPVEDIVRTYQFPEPLLKKLVLPSKSIRTEAMRSLYRTNITNATLFPDLDGLAKSIAFELEIIWKGLIAEPRTETGVDAAQGVGVAQAHA